MACSLRGVTGHRLSYAVILQHITRDFSSNYGFLPARGDNLAYEITPSMAGTEIERLSRLSERLRRHNWIKIRSADLQHWEDEVERVYILLNKALAHLPDFIPWPREGLQASLEQFRQIVDPELVLFAEVDGEAVGWFPGIPNVNEALIHANGLRYPWDYLQGSSLLAQTTQMLGDQERTCAAGVLGYRGGSDAVR